MHPPTFAALAVATLTLTACGATGKDDSAPPTRAEFIATTDAQCKVSNARTKTLNEQAQRVADSASNEKDLLAKLAPILARGYGQIRDNAAAFQALNPPSADAAAIERIRKLYDQQAELVRKLAAAAKAGDANQFEALSTHQAEVLTSARKATRAFGFKECGSTNSDAA